MYGRRIAGFSLLELLVALLLLALISALLYGSLHLAADSWDRGESKSEQIRQIRFAEEFPRQTFAAAYPLRPNSTIESPLPFAESLGHVSCASARARRRRLVLLHARTHAWR